MECERILRLLPWRQPFLMIERMIECTPHEHIVTRKNVTAGDGLVAISEAGAWFPGVLLLEGMSQSAALLFVLSYGANGSPMLPLLGFLKAALHGSARPGDAVDFHVRSLKMTPGGGVFSAEARSTRGVLAEAELAFAASGESSVAAGPAS